MRSKACNLGLLLAGALFVAPASAHDPIIPPNPEAPLEVPLHDDLGDLSYSIDTGSELAQRYFDQGLRLAYAFHHAEALRSFRAARRQDPDCAMCYWGEVYVVGPNINAGMERDSAKAAVAAIHKAMALARDPREKALIDALSLRYSADPGSDQAELNRAYAEAMRGVLERYSEDRQIGVLYADAVMNTTPWNYWKADGVTPKGAGIAHAIETIERVLKIDPDHPGAIHLYIHLMEASKHADRAEPYADKLAALMPGAGHLVHMPSHIYYRIGRYRDSAATNKKAVRVDERAFERMDTLDIYRNGYYPHNIHFVIASAQMAGDGATALEYAERLRGKIAHDAADRIGWVQRILAVPYYAHAQFSAPEVVLTLADPGDRYPLVKAMWHYARGVAYANSGNPEGARIEAARIAAIGQDADFSMLRAWGVPATDMIRIARHVVSARAALREGDTDGAVRQFRIAVSIQDAMAYMEPPWWYYPVRQSLGASLIAAGRPGEAIAVIKDSLERYPNNVHALHVLELAQHAIGDDESAERTARRIRQASIGNSRPTTLDNI
jgi:tetratricopeptide (TPR) repeat protein